MKVIILGCGPAGLIAGRRVLEEFSGAHVTFVDRRPTESLRSPEVEHPFFIHENVGADLGISLNEAEIQEAVLSTRPSADWPNLWSLNTIGTLTRNRMWEITEERSIRKWYVAKSLLSDLFDRVPHLRYDIFGNSTLKSINLASKEIAFECPDGQGPDGGVGPWVGDYDWLINTIPLPTFCDLASVKGDLVDSLSYAPLTIYSWDMRGDEQFNKVAQVYYHPEGDRGWVRFSNTFGLVTMELANKTSGLILNSSQLPIGYSRLADIKPKISSPNLRFIPVAKEKVNRFVHRLTRAHQVLMIGRFAMWRYKRVDHLPQDARHIVEIMESEMLAQGVEA